MARKIRNLYAYIESIAGRQRVCQAYDLIVDPECSVPIVVPATCNREE